MTTGKTLALSRQTFVGKVMSLLFNMLSRVGHNFGLQSMGWGHKELDVTEHACTIFPNQERDMIT